MKYQLSNHGGNIREATERFGLSQKAFLDFSADINPLGLFPKVKNIIAKNINSLLFYPDPDCKFLKEELANFMRIGPHNLMIGNGSVELIYLVPRSLSTRAALISIPTFSEYELSVKSSNARVIFVKADVNGDFQINIENFIKYIPKVDLIFICNPNNPTASLLFKDEIMFLLKRCQNQRPMVFVDEAFMDFVQDQNNASVVKEAAKLKNLLVLRSLTKFFALPGLRLGYLVGHRDLIAKLKRYQYPWNVNSFAQLVGREIIKDKNYIQRNREFIIRERAFLFEKLKKIKRIVPFIPTANFIFCRLSEGGISSKMLFNKLGKRGILIRDCSNFRGLNDRYFRIAVRKRSENIKLLAALREILG